ncbi:hypothetical protein K3495_g11437 [Podosphaera aphanis]|nr:hypothetical protein K3495_g11437 [Podosphaera aphanis]
MRRATPERSRRRSAPIGLAVVGYWSIIAEFPPSQFEIRAEFQLDSSHASLENVDLYAADAPRGRKFSNLLRRPDIQALLINIPFPLQPEYIEDSLAAGKHVLSRAPIASDIKSALKLIYFYEDQRAKNGALWSVYRNTPFERPIVHGRKKIRDLGSVENFSVRVTGEAANGTELTNENRFLIDQGIAFVAGIRTLLGEEEPLLSLAAFTTSLDDNLSSPQSISINSIWKLLSGVSGTFNFSLGRNSPGVEYVVACAGGNVTVTDTEVIVKNEVGEEIDYSRFPLKRYSIERNDFKDWARAIKSGRCDDRLYTESALGDLEIFVKMLQSSTENASTCFLVF